MQKKPTARGGKRAGAGRPTKKQTPPPSSSSPAAPATPRELPWREIRQSAEVGAEEPEIIRALGLPELALKDAATLTRFREEVAAGHARYKLELRKTIHKRGQRTSKTAGSVNALALQARNILDWDKQLPTQEVEPDLGTARQRLRDLFVKLAASRSEIEGKTVTPLELLYREAESDRRATPAPA